jgi:hypothetical protein
METGKSDVKESNRKGPQRTPGQVVVTSKTTVALQIELQTDPNGKPSSLPTPASLKSSALLSHLDRVSNGGNANFSFAGYESVDVLNVDCSCLFAS